MEELKLILSQINSLGEEARYIFILWIIKEAIIYTIGFSCLAATIVCAYKVINRIIFNAIGEKRILEAIGRDYFSKSVVDKIVKIIEEYKKCQ